MNSSKFYFLPYCLFLLPLWLLLTSARPEEKQPTQLRKEYTAKFIPPPEKKVQQNGELLAYDSLNFGIYGVVASNIGWLILIITLASATATAGLSIPINILVALLLIVAGHILGLLAFISGLTGRSQIKMTNGNHWLYRRAGKGLGIGLAIWFGPYFLSLIITALILLIKKL